MKQIINNDLKSRLTFSCNRLLDDIDSLASLSLFERIVVNSLDESITKFLASLSEIPTE